MVQASFSFIAIFLATITGVLDNPPEDLLSLGDTKAVLTQLKVEQSEESLIKLISGETQVKSDTSELDKALKQLREGSSKERKEARKILTAAGEEHKEFFEKIQDDPDPEVSETAKNILNKFEAAKNASRQSGMTDDILKVLVIRRLTELKSSKALDIVAKLKEDKNKDIAREAARAHSILQGIKPKRPARGEASGKLLRMAPADVGFAALMDLTEPSKTMQLADYLGMMKKVPGMDAGMITGMFHQSLPMILSQVGNPRVDSILFTTHKNLGVDKNDSWAGFIATGSYNSEKMHTFLKNNRFEKKVENGTVYWEQRWGPSICPVNDEILIMSFGENDSNHMSKMLVNVKKPNEKAVGFQLNTEESRLVAGGALTDKQKELMKQEIKQEIARLEGRNRMGVQAEKAMMNLALLTADSEKFEANYKDKILTIICDMNNEVNAGKMVTAVDNADKDIRETFKQIPFPAFQAMDLEKRFTKAAASGKKVTVKIKGEFFDVMTLFPFMAFAQMGNRVQADPVVEAVDAPVPQQNEKK